MSESPTTPEAAIPHASGGQPDAVVRVARPEPEPTSSRSSHDPAFAERAGSPEPSIHLRVVATWLTIYPIVATGAAIVRAIAPTMPLWASIWILTGIAIPLGVYLIVPKIMLPLVAAIWRRGMGVLKRVFAR